jgi:hypothetical protein
MYGDDESHTHCISRFCTVRDALDMQGNDNDLDDGEDQKKQTMAQKEIISEQMVDMLGDRLAALDKLGMSIMYCMFISGVR